MTKLMNDILRQPGELQKSLEHTLNEGRHALARGAALVRGAEHVFITGIGSSWHAGMAIQALFNAAGRPVHLADASELLHFTALSKGAVVIALSRSGKSVEIVKLLDKAEKAGAHVVGVTNTPGSPLGKRAEAVLRLNTAFDHNISITMYSALTLVGGLLAAETLGTLNEALAKGLQQTLVECENLLPAWRDKVEAHTWFEPETPTYLLARGAGMASASETRLLWEEGAKAPACAMTTGGFRHGPQEILAGKVRVGLWIDEQVLREQDLALAADLKTRGARVMVIGRDVPADAADLVLPVPPTPPGWQFLADIMPGQVAAERLARARNADCDNFLICPYIIEKEGGL